MNLICKLRAHRWRKRCVLCHESRYHDEGHVTVAVCTRCHAKRDLGLLENLPWEDA